MKSVLMQVLLIGLGGALPVACALPSPISLLHGRQGIKVQGVAVSDYDLDSDVQVGGAVGSTKGINTDVTGIGLQYEFFVGPENVSLQAGVERREYDPTGRVAGDGIEVSGGARFYFNQDEQLQPFLSLLFAYGFGLDTSPGLESDGYWRYGAGGGVSFFFNKWVAAEALVHYEGTLTDLETTFAPGVVQKDSLNGWAVIFGLGFFF